MTAALKHDVATQLALRKNGIPESISRIVYVYVNEDYETIPKPCISCSRNVPYSRCVGRFLDKDSKGGSK